VGCDSTLHQLTGESQILELKPQEEPPALTIDQVLESARLRSEERQIERYAQRRLTHFVPSEARWKRVMWLVVAVVDPHARQVGLFGRDEPARARVLALLRA